MRTLVYKHAQSNSQYDWPIRHCLRDVVTYAFAINSKGERIYPIDIEKDPITTTLVFDKPVSGFAMLYTVDNPRNQNDVPTVEDLIKDSGLVLNIDVPELATDEQIEQAQANYNRKYCTNLAKTMYPRFRELINDIWVYRVTVDNEKVINHSLSQDLDKAVATFLSGFSFVNIQNKDDYSMSVEYRVDGSVVVVHGRGFLELEAAFRHDLPVLNIVVGDGPKYWKAIDPELKYSKIEELL